jgi:hypothetical protein
LKTGRNEPCPCSSGKKYKRCCLEKDEQFETAKLKVLNKKIKRNSIKDELCFPDEDFINIENPDEIENYSSFTMHEHGEILPEIIKLYRENTSKEFYLPYEESEDELLDKDELSGVTPGEPASTQSYSFNENDFIPTVSLEEKMLIDKWWDEYRCIKDRVAKLEHLKSFLDEHPHLDVNMHLHHALISSLQKEFERREDYYLFIEFLIYFREKHINAYTLSFGCYDESLITFFLVGQKTNKEIVFYFSLFKKYPVKFINKLMDVVFMIISFGREDLLQDLYQDIYIPLDRSRFLVDHYLIIEPYLLYQWSPFVKQLADSKGNQFEIVDALHKKQLHFSSKLKNANIYTGKKRLARSLQECFGDLAIPPFPHPFNFIRTKMFYSLITEQFKGYQVRTLLRPWILSHNISSDIFYFLLHPLRNYSIPRYPFRFNKDLIDNFLSTNFKDFSSRKTHEATNFLLGLVDFCNYLKEKELISTDEFQQLHEAASGMLDSFCELSDEYVMTYYRSLIIKEKHKQLDGKNIKMSDDE